MARRASGPCRCHELGEECPSCLAAIARRMEGDSEREPAGGFDRDFHYPRDLAPRSPW